MNKKTKSPFRKKLDKLLVNKLAVFGLVLLVVTVLASILAPILTGYLPNAISYGETLQKPSLLHIMGTDKLGRDVFSRVLYGGRTSIFIGVTAAVIGPLIGMVLGGVAGYFGGWIDSVLVRFSEVILTFPSMILILIMVSFMGQGVGNLIIIFSITGWMTPFRMIRNQFLSLREETYVEVCKSFGFSQARIIFRHILPNTISPLVVTATINMAGYILSEAGLSFIGVGVPAQTPTWGSILNAAKSIDVITNNWWLWLFPGLVLSFFVLGVNFLGDGLRDAFDPKQ